MINVQGRSAGKSSFSNFTDNPIDIYWPGGATNTAGY
jgi:hypothetical protein